MKRILLLVLVFLFYINPTHAVTITDPLLFNFQGGNGEQLPAAFPSVSNPLVTVDGMATGNIGTDSTPWLNGPVDDGGLGVCNNAIGGDCTAGMSAAHALGNDETLKLTFTTANPFDLTRIYFLNSNNGTDFSPDAQFGFSVNGGPVELFSLTHIFDFIVAPTIGNGDFIEFFWAGDIFCQECKGEFGVGEDYFIAGLVPIPAALPLFLSALFGFAFFSRRRSATA